MAGMGVSYSVSTDRELSVDERVTTQTLLNRRSQIHQRLQVLRELDMSIEFKNQCPKCAYQVTLEEVLEGFDLSKTYDTRTECPKCREKFQPEIEFNHLAHNGSYTFYCETQALQALEDEYENMNPMEILEDNPGLFISSLVHFGAIPNAFKMIDTEYNWKFKYNKWKERAIPYLNIIPVGVLAEVLGVSNSSLYKLKKLHAKE
ncbi:MAG: hypothetical protein ACK4NC_00115 [Candidatus Gracilibacteria bacterium]